VVKAKRVIRAKDPEVDQGKKFLFCHMDLPSGWSDKRELTDKDILKTERVKNRNQLRASPPKPKRALKEPNSSDTVFLEGIQA
jgi:hypothetical protein